MIVAKCFRDQLRLDIGLLTTGYVDTGYGSQFFDLWNDIVIYLVIEVIHAVIVDGEGDGRRTVDIHLDDRRGIDIIREIRLDPIQLLL